MSADFDARLREASLEEILRAREERAALREALRRQYGLPVIAFTMNVAGPVKTSPLLRRAFLWGVARLKEALAPRPLREKQLRFPITGEEGYFVVEAPAEELKSLCVALEEECPLGRLFDLDVTSPSGEALSRPRERGCLICGAAGRACAASRAHSYEELQKKTKEILTEHFLREDAEAVGRLAERALMAEVDTTPKPGLVDRNNSGSHRDMNRSHFYASAQALRPFFREAFSLGREGREEDSESLFFRLRAWGKRAEEAMFSATGGVNTHKGAVFSLGILCAALGNLSTAEEPFLPYEELLRRSGELARFALADFERAGDSAGLVWYRRLGVRGIRGEAAEGFPSVAAALKYASEAEGQGLDSNRVAADTLIFLLARAEDTVLYHRGGEEGALWARREAASLLAREPYPSEEAILRLDEAFIARSLSPGGCADLLALVLFLREAERAAILQT